MLPLHAPVSKTCRCSCGCIARIFEGGSKCDGCAKGFHDDGKLPPDIPKIIK